MSKFNQSLSLVVLPLVATAVLFADSLRASSSAVNTSLVNSVVKQEDDEGLKRTLKAQYIRLDDSNRLTGTISAIQKETGNTIGVSGLEVTLVQKSQVVSRSMTDARGEFVSQEMNAGNYTLCVSGDDGFLAYGIHVIEQQIDEGDVVPVPDVGAVKSADSTSALVSTRKKLMLDPAVEITAAVIPPEFTALNQIMSNFVPAGVGLNMSGSEDDSQINVEDSVVAGGFKITLQEDGKLIGRIAPLASDNERPIRLQNMNAFLILDDEIYGRTNVEEDGTFEFNQVEPNVYGFAAAGDDGFAAISFQAIEAASPEVDASNSMESTFRNASTKRNESNASDELQVAICPPEDTPYLRRKINDLNSPDRIVDGGAGDGAGVPGTGTPVNAPMGGGFPDGGGFGGGGYGGENFNWGGLVEAGLAAWVISELVDRDDNNNFIPPPVSPFTTR